MKVAVFYPTSIWNHNPFDTAERRVFEYLAKNYGWEITLFVDCRNNYNYTGSILKIRKVMSLPNILQFPLSVIQRFIKYIPIPLYIVLLIKKELQDYDIVLTENPWYPLTIYPYFQAKRYIVVDSKILDQKINKTVFSITKKAHGILCITELVAEKYKRLGLISNKEIQKIRIVGGHPIDTDLFSPPESYPDDKIIRIVSTGRLVHEKGFHIVIEAFKDVIQRHTNIRLDIIGDGSDKISLEKKVYESGLKGHIVFCGTLSSEEISEKYQTSHIFINHSLDTPNWQEYFGVVNLEAMSSGLPVVTTDSGAIPWVVKNNAIIVKQKDIKALIHAVESLILGRNKRIQLGNAGREFVKSNYTVKIIANRYYNAICEVLAF